MGLALWKVESINGSQTLRLGDPPFVAFTIIPRFLQRLSVGTPGLWFSVLFMLLSQSK